MTEPNGTHQRVVENERRIDGLERAERRIEDQLSDLRTKTTENAVRQEGMREDVRRVEDATRDILTSVESLKTSMGERFTTEAAAREREFTNIRSSVRWAAIFVLMLVGAVIAAAQFLAGVI